MIFSLKSAQIQLTDKFPFFKGTVLCSTHFTGNIEVKG